MGQAPVARALQTRPLLLFRHRSTPDPKGSARCHWGRTPACVNPGAPVVGAARIAARLDPGRVEGRPPALRVVARELEIVALRAMPRSASPMPATSSTTTEARGARADRRPGEPLPA